MRAGKVRRPQLAAARSVAREFGGGGGWAPRKSVSDCRGGRAGRRSRGRGRDGVARGMVALVDRKGVDA